MKGHENTWGNLLVQAEQDAANALHQRRSWLHRAFWRADVRSLGYCCACMPVALAVVDAARDDAGQLRTLFQAALKKALTS